MKKKFLPYLVLLVVSLPQTALAHYENPHDSFWNVPMHWLVEHYIAMTLIGVGLISAAIYLRRGSEKE